MNLHLRRSPLSLILFFIISGPVLVQAQGPIREENVRAALTFLASDAMQGRGSGTTYERIAAEYIGSQFRQFGLEPGGDADGAGNKGFVQRVGLQSSKFTAAPTFVPWVGTLLGWVVAPVGYLIVASAYRQLAPPSHAA